MNSTINNEDLKNLTIKSLDEIKTEILQLNQKIEDIRTQIDIITNFLIPEEKPELEEYLRQTMDTVIKLNNENDGRPISRFDLAEELDIHPNTAYLRAEKLVQKRKLCKYYGRELGLKRFEEKKAVFYSLLQTIYNEKFLHELGKKNRVAHRIALTLLQQQPLTEEVLLKTHELSSNEVKNGLKYLLQRGLIIQETKKNLIQYRIRKFETEEETSNHKIEE